MEKITTKQKIIKLNQLLPRNPFYIDQVFKDLETYSTRVTELVDMDYEKYFGDTNQANMEILNKLLAIFPGRSFYQSIAEQKYASDKQAEFLKKDLEKSKKMGLL